MCKQHREPAVNAVARLRDPFFIVFQKVIFSKAKPYLSQDKR